jgi:hypothetical protein
MKRVANKNARPCVQNREAFQGSNIFAEWRGDDTFDARYIVYSYGKHFPMYIWTDGKWYGNSDKYSRTTSKHQGQAHPPVAGSEIEWRDTDAMVAIADRGIAGWVAYELRKEAA